MGGEERREAVPPGYKMTEVGVIPEDWETVSLGDLDPFVTSGSRGWAAFYSDAGSLFVRITNLSRSRIYLDMSDVRWLQLPVDNAEGKRTQLHPGDLLVSITADIGIIGYVDDSIPSPAFINQHIALLRIGQSRANSQFIAYFLASHGPQKLFLASTDTGAKTGMNLETVRIIRTALPPLPEQRAIAGALSDVDNLLDALDRLIAKKRAVKQAAMQQLLNGKTRLPGFAGEWEETTLGEIATTFGGLTGKTKSDFGRGSSRYISFLSVLEHPWIDDSTPTERVTIARSETQNHVQRGDVLFNGTSETPEDLAMGSALETDVRDLYLNSFCFGLRPRNDSSFNSRYVAYFFRGAPGRALMSSLAQGATRYNLSKAQFLSLSLHLPPLPEQRAIADILSDMDDEITALEKRRDKMQCMKEGMMQQLLTGRVRLLKSGEKEWERV